MIADNQLRKFESSISHDYASTLILEKLIKISVASLTSKNKIIKRFYFTFLNLIYGKPKYTRTCPCILSLPNHRLTTN